MSTSLSTPASSDVTPLLETQPLRERFREAERLTRELIQHLEHGFLPKAGEVREMVRRGSRQEEMANVADHSIRTSVDAAVTSHEYTLDVVRRLERYLRSIDSEVKEILSNDQGTQRRGPSGNKPSRS